MEKKQHGSICEVIMPCPRSRTGAGWPWEGQLVESSPHWVGDEALISAELVFREYHVSRMRICAGERSDWVNGEPVKV